ncbi:hypothetical protein L9F63_019330, partial [Diploptera punctata]
KVEWLKTSWVRIQNYVAKKGRLNTNLRTTTVIFMDAGKRGRKFTFELKMIFRFFPPHKFHNTIDYAIFA